MNYFHMAVQIFLSCCHIMTLGTRNISNFIMDSLDVTFQMTLCIGDEVACGTGYVGNLFMNLIHVLIEVSHAGTFVIT